MYHVEEWIRYGYSDKGYIEQQSVRVGDAFNVEPRIRLIKQNIKLLRSVLNDSSLEREIIWYY